MNRPKNESIAFFISFALHCLFLILLTLYIAWTPPDPPIEQYGIDIALDTEGEANYSAQEIPQNKEITDINTEATPTHSVDEPTPEESTDAPTETESEIPLDKAIPEAKDIQAELKPEAKTETKENEKPIPNNTKEVTEKKTETKQPIIDEKGLYDNDTKAQSKKGNPNASSLDITGWIWDELPKPEEKSHESGKIIFEIKIDSDGYIISVKTLESNVSPEVEKIYKETIEKLTFSPTSPESLKNKESIGKITFLITAK
ncbi:MAG: hypothetical protein QM536_01155 [Chitinophagaceae bacterium]|nr:hypothetical protein [Chitinophagaceae bacterium]